MESVTLIWKKTVIKPLIAVEKKETQKVDKKYVGEKFINNLQSFVKGILAKSLIPFKEVSDKARTIKRIAAYRFDSIGINKPRRYFAYWQKTTT